MSPKVSIILPTRNRQAMLMQALQSVHSQSRQDWELWVVDDASQDGSSTAVEQQFPRAKLLRTTQRQGVSGARNLAMKQAEGEYFAFLDDDDLWHPLFLEKMLGALERFPSATLAFSGHLTIGADGATFGADLGPFRTYPSLTHYLLSEAFVHATSLVVCRSAAVRQVGLMNPALTYVQDLDFYYRLLQAGGFVHVPETLVKVRVHNNNLTGQRWQWYQEELLWMSSTIQRDGRLQGEADRLIAYRMLYHASRFWKAREPWRAARLGTEAWLRCPWFSLSTVAAKWRRRRSSQRHYLDMLESGLHLCAN